jgi:membrane protein YqaA with SNARE-associated domain
MKPLKSLYQWVLSWAESAYGTLVLFLVAFAESSFFPVPADPLLMALCLGKVKKSMYYVFMCTLGSVLGGVFGFIIGYYLWYTPGGELTGIANFFYRVIPGFSPEVFDNVGAQYDAHNFLVIFTAAFTPIPYKVFSITAGVFQINLPIFIIASILGRGGRFVIIGLLIRFFGEPIKVIMDKHFNTFIIVLTIIFALSYVLVAYMLKKGYKMRKIMVNTIINALKCLSIIALIGFPKNLINNPIITNLPPLPKMDAIMKIGRLI